jgi:hypothetical protein
MRRCIILCVVLPILAAVPVRSSAADAPAPSEAELQRQAAEVERLRHELEQAQSELKRLEQENARLKAQPAQPATQDSTPVSAPVAPARPHPPATAAPPEIRPAPTRAADLPPLEENTVVDVDDLIRQFRDDPEGAALRYSNHVLRVRGIVEGFNVASFTRSYSVTLESPERHLDLRAEFNYLNKYRRVHTRQNGRELIGWIDDRSWQSILRAGQSVLMRGRCQGFKDDVIKLTGATVLPDAAPN